MIRKHNNANMLSIGARVVGEGLALDIVDAFLTAEFEGGRHASRVEMIGGPGGVRIRPDPARINTVLRNLLKPKQSL